MENQFYKFLQSLEDISFITPSEEEIKKLLDLSSDKLTDMFIEVYSKKVPADEVNFEEFVFYGIDRIVDENTNYIPGANILPYGLFTFASTFDGDSICFDLNNPDFPVYHCSHEILCDESEISYYDEDGMQTLDYNFENILKVSGKLADSFDEFVNKLLSGIW